MRMALVRSVTLFHFIYLHNAAFDYVVWVEALSFLRRTADSGRNSIGLEARDTDANAARWPGGLTGLKAFGYYGEEVIHGHDNSVQYG